MFLPFYHFNYSDKDTGINGEAFFNLTVTGESDNVQAVQETFQLHENGSLTLKKTLDSTKKDKYDVNKVVVYNVLFLKKI